MQNNSQSASSLVDREPAEVGYVKEKRDWATHSTQEWNSVNLNFYPRVKIHWEKVVWVLLLYCTVLYCTEILSGLPLSER